MDTLEAPLSLWKDRLEIGAKATVGFLAASYAMGLIIMNSHLARYGLTLFNLLEVQYVLVGIGWWCVVGITTWSVALLWSRIVGDGPEFWTKNTGLAIISSLGVFVFCVILIISVLYVITAGAIELDGNGFRTAMKLSLFCFIAQQSGIQFWYAARSTKKSSLLLSEHSIQLVARIGSVVLLVSIYTHDVYPKQSRLFGGVPDQEIQLVVKPDQATLLGTLGIGVQEDGLSVPLKLLLETSDFLVVLPPKIGTPNWKTSAIKIRSDAVEFVLYATN